VGAGNCPLFADFMRRIFPKPFVYGSIASHIDGWGKCNTARRGELGLAQTLQEVWDQTDPNKSRHKTKRGSKCKIAAAKCVSSLAKLHILVQLAISKI